MPRKRAKFILFILIVALITAILSKIFFINFQYKTLSPEEEVDFLKKLFANAPSWQLQALADHDISYDTEVVLNYSEASCELPKRFKRQRFEFAQLVTLSECSDNFTRISATRLQMYGNQWLANAKLSNCSQSIDNRCNMITGRRFLINYAGSGCCKTSQPLNCQTGLMTGGFDGCIMFDEKSIDWQFAMKNCHIFRRLAGSGLWLWKPYVIFRTLLALEDGDMLFYSDSGAEFVKNIDTSLLCHQVKINQDVVVFSVGLPEQQYTKEDAFILLDCLTKDCRQTPQRLASFIMFRRSHVSLRFAAEYLAYSQDFRIISSLSNFFQSNYPDIKGHRHDQSILSLLSKKWGIEAWPDPSDYGNNENDTETMQLKNKLQFRFMMNTFFISHTRQKE